MDGTKKRWCWDIVRLLCQLVLFGGLIALATLESSGTIKGIVFRESFLRWRTTSYWRSVLAEKHETGQISNDNHAALSSLDARQVLAECLADEDFAVRWEALAYMDEACRYSSVGITHILTALNDPHPQVREFAAILAGSYRREGLGALPELTNLAKNDADASVRTIAENAIWNIDQRKAMEVGTWNEFESNECQFAVAFPGTPRHHSTTGINGEIQSHRFASEFGPNVVFAQVFIYPSDVILRSVDDLVVASDDPSRPQVNEKLLEEKPVSQNGLNGMERIKEREDGVKFRSRAFVYQNRFYAASVVYYDTFTCSPVAAEFFLDSFRIVADQAVESADDCGEEANRK